MTEYTSAAVYVDGKLMESAMLRFNVHIGRNLIRVDMMTDATSWYWIQFPLFAVIEGRERLGKRRIIYKLRSNGIVTDVYAEKTHEMFLLMFDGCGVRLTHPNTRKFVINTRRGNTPA